MLAVGGAAKSGHPPYRGRPHGFGCDCPWLGHAALHVRLAHCGRLSCMLSSVIDEWGPWAAQSPSEYARRLAAHGPSLLPPNSSDRSVCRLARRAAGSMQRLRHQMGWATTRPAPRQLAGCEETGLDNAT